jgi:hypothetical protein
MKQIYLDQHQCKEFGVKYFERCWFEINAAALLASKLNGYDRQHTAFLKPLGESTMVLLREDFTPPGWFDVVRIQAIT